jgi:hypothetical protein
MRGFLVFLFDAFLRFALDGVIFDHRTSTTTIRGRYHYTRTDAGSNDGCDTALQQPQGS